MIRHWQAEDLQEVTRLAKKSDASIWSAAQIAESFTQHTGFVLTADNSIAGFAVFLTVKPEAELLNIIIDPSKRRQGHAARLLSHCLMQLADEGFTQCFLEVSENNPAAIHLYAQLGFMQTGLRKHYYRSRVPFEDAYLYRLDL